MWVFSNEGWKSEQLGKGVWEVSGGGGDGEGAVFRGSPWFGSMQGKG